MSPKATGFYASGLFFFLRCLFTEVPELFLILLGSAWFCFVCAGLASIESALADKGKD